MMWYVSVCALFISHSRMFSSFVHEVINERISVLSCQNIISLCMWPQSLYLFLHWWTVVWFVLGYCEETFCKRRHTNGQKREIFNITNNQGYANQNHEDGSLHACLNGDHKKIKSKDSKDWWGCSKKLLLGMQISITVRDGVANSPQTELGRWFSQ